MLNHTQSAFINEAPGVYRVTRALSAEEICLQAKAIMAKKFERGAHIGGAQDAKEYFVHFLTAYEKEVFSVIYLDSQNRVIGCEVASEGTIDHSVIYPREIVKRALQLNAAKLIVSHNHPSGTSKPSEADKAITKALGEALSLFSIRLIDHFIIGSPHDVFSFAEAGFI